MPNAIITNTDPGNFTSDGVYVDQVSPQPATPTGPQTGLLAIVGTRSDGALNVPTPFTTQSDLFAAFGNGTTLNHSLVREALSAMPECTQFLGVGVSDGTDTVASISIIDTVTPTAGIVATLVRKVTGSYANGASARVDLQSGTLAAAPVLRVTIFYPNAPAEVYVVAGSSGGAYSSTVFVANLLAAINVGTASQAASPRWTAVAGTSTQNVLVATVFNASGGTNGDQFAPAPSAPAAPVISTSGTAGSSQYQYELVQVGNGDSAPSTVGNLTTGNATLSVSNYNIVTCTTVAGVKYKLLRQVGGAGGYMLIDTFTASGTSTIINDQGQFTPVAYVAAPNITADAALLGVDGITGRTGMYALRSLVQGAQVILAALTDATIGQTLIQFVVEENAIAHIAIPSNTTTTAAIAEKVANVLSNPSLIVDMDWDYTYDAVSQQQLLVSPMGKIAGAIAAQPAYQYPGNQQVNGVVGITGTERISNGVSTISNAEAGQRQQNGLLYLGYMPRAPLGPALGLPHGLASDGSLISDVRMLKSVSFAVQQILGTFVGDMLTNDPSTDPTMEQAQAALQNYFQTLLKPIPQIASYQVIIGASNNTQVTIAQGFLIATILVKTLSAAQYVLALVQVGKTVQVLAQAA